MKKFAIFFSSLLLVSLIAFGLWLFLWGIHSYEIEFSTPSNCSIGEIEFTGTKGFFYVKNKHKRLSYTGNGQRPDLREMTVFSIWQWDTKANIIVPVIRGSDNAVIKQFTLTEHDRDTGSEPWPLVFSLWGQCNEHDIKIFR